MDGRPLTSEADFIKYAEDLAVKQRGGVPQQQFQPQAQYAQQPQQQAQYAGTWYFE